MYSLFSREAEEDIPSLSSFMPRGCKTTSSYCFCSEQMFQWLQQKITQEVCLKAKILFESPVNVRKIWNISCCLLEKRWDFSFPCSTGSRAGLVALLSTRIVLTPYTSFTDGELPSAITLHLSIDAELLQGNQTGIMFSSMLSFHY